MYHRNMSQEERILHILSTCADWVSGMYFLGLESPITQYHARIFGLQKRGYTIEGRFKEGKNYKEYKLIRHATTNLFASGVNE